MVENPCVAVAHEHFPQHGGGEHVAEELARTFDAPIYTGFVNTGVPSTDVEVHDLFGDGVSGHIIKGGSKLSILFRDLYYMTHWDHVPQLHQYDVIIQSGNNPGWYVPKEEQTIIKYVHTPPRNPYDRHSEFADSLKHTVFAHVVRTLYNQTHSYPDKYVANSELVARRCEQYFGVSREEVDVVYPPVDVDSYGPEYAEEMDRDDFYFTFSRLFPGKNIDIIIEAFNRLGPEYQLIVGGSGPERERLEKLAGPNIEFRGYVSETEKRQLCAGAKAGVFAAENEDFGIVPIEFFASGTPVIGVADGFTKHQIMDGKNGRIFSKDIAQLIEIIKQFENNGVSMSSIELESFAEQFSVDKFRNRIKEIVEKTQCETMISSPWCDKND